MQRLVPPVVFGDAEARDRRRDVFHLRHFLFQCHSPDEIGDARFEGERLILVGEGLRARGEWAEQRQRSNEEGFQGFMDLRKLKAVTQRARRTATAKPQRAQRTLRTAEHQNSRRTGIPFFVSPFLSFFPSFSLSLFRPFTFVAARNELTKIQATAWHRPDARLAVVASPRLSSASLRALRG